MEETALSGFLSGFATAFFALHAYQLFRRENSSRLQRVVAVIFVQWALFNLKDFLLTIHDYNNQDIQDLLALIDGTSLIGYTSLVYELIRPNWASWRKAVWMLLAYIPFFAAWWLWRNDVVIRCYMVCLFVAGTVIFLLWLRDVRRYARYIRESYSNIDEIDISWLRVVAWFFVSCQLLWVVISIIRHPLTDCLYYILCIVLWQITLEHVLRQRTITIEESPKPTSPNDVREYSFAQSLPAIIESEELYLNPTLSIKDLATRIGTNRTYLSDYFTHVQQTTFYDYINHLRIEKKSIPLMQQHLEYTLEQIATESGFQSISTFRRSFQKLKGVTPSEYRKGKQHY
jgi:AraC-like DNA-binding protein